MNNCSQAPQTEETAAAARAYLESWNRSGMDWDEWMAEVERARVSFAALINADPSEVALCTSVSQATSSLASSLDFTGRRNRVVATEAEFPTVAHVWLAQGPRGARVDWVPVRNGIVEVEDYEHLLDSDTLVVSVTHGYYASGFKQDLEAIVRKAHAVGALAYVDAYQTLGTHALDVKELGVDFLASGNLKFLMGVPGIAFLYVREDLAERLKPTITGWHGRKDPFAFTHRTLDWAPGARRFDTGTPPVPNAYVARAGMEIVQEVGPARIQRWTEELSRHLIEGGRARGLELHGTDDPRRKTPTTAFVCHSDSHAVEEAMKERGVVPSARGHVIRLAPHFYSTLDDVEVALDTLVEVLGQLPRREGS
jgi:selenocysteine lyase/cysteine desulfurase